MTVADDLRDLIPPAEERAKPSSQQNRALDSFFASVLHMDPTAVYTVSSSKPGNLKVRLHQSERGRGAAISVALIPRHEDLEGTLKAAKPLVGSGRRRAVVVVGEDPSAGWGVIGLVERSGGPVAAALLPHWPQLTREDAAGVAPSLSPAGGFMVPLTMDSRTARMARLAIAAAPAVLLVGPPGTGKNRLLQEILAEIAEDSGRLGFTKARDVVIEPAEEGWTTRDLVGGETVDERARLRFRPGRVLDAIAHDRWLVIDEANRADLDKIFGPLLTWLSGQQVVVGRASTDVDAPMVRLGWRDDADSTATGVERLSDDDVGSDPIDYLAGTEFRLLGTYNALDAHRVFRFGLALGRRFSQVPVPPASAEDFALMLDSYEESFPSPDHWSLVRDIIRSLYGAHLATAGAQLGPAMFLGLPEYVGTGVSLPDVAFDGGGVDDEGVRSLVVEGYLLSTGAWLARLDDSELADLGTAISAVNGAPLEHAEWQWVVSQLPLIGG